MRRGDRSEAKIFVAGWKFSISNPKSEVAGGGRIKTVSTGAGAVLIVVFRAADNNIKPK
jgi:hypothetical protein